MFTRFSFLLFWLHKFFSLICFSISCFRVDFIVYFILTCVVVVFLCVYLVSSFHLLFVFKFFDFLLSKYDLCSPLFLTFARACSFSLIFSRCSLFRVIKLLFVLSTNCFRMGRCFQMDAFTSVCMYVCMFFCLRFVNAFLFTCVG